MNLTTLERNRRNAQRSTGPRSPEGKAAASMNALRHGLTAGAALVPGEDRATFEGMAARLRDELAPVGELEEQLAARITAALWRLHRLERVEAGIFAWQWFEEHSARARGEVNSYEVNDSQEFLNNLGGETRITDQTKHKAALVRLAEAYGKQREDLPTLGRAFMRDAEKADALSKLSRYEAGIERALYRALHEYQRARASRMGAALPPPAVLDVDLEVTHQGAAP